MQDITRYSVLCLTPKALPLLRGEESLVLARARVEVVREKKRAARPKVRRGGALVDVVEVEPTPADELLFERLRTLRKGLADEQGVPPYVVFGDKALWEMAVRRPGTRDAFLDVNGVGNAKLERYGDVFINAIAEFEDQPGN